METEQEAFLEYLIADGVLTDVVYDNLPSQEDLSFILEWSQETLAHHMDIVYAEDDPQLWLL